MVDQFSAVNLAGRQESPEKQAVTIVADSDEEDFPCDETADAEICKTRICFHVLPSQGTIWEQSWNGAASDIVTAKREGIEQQREAENDSGGTKTTKVRNDQYQEGILTVRQTRIRLPY